MAERELAILIRARDMASKTINGVSKSVSNLDRGLGRAGKGVGQVGAGLARAGAVIATAAVTGLGAAAKLGADFEAQLNTINTIAHLSKESLDGVGDGIRDLARQGRGDLADLSAGFYDVLSAGITDTADAQKVLAAASTLAIGGLATTAQTVDLLTTAINAYHMDASSATAVADLFAKSIEIGKVTADEIAASLANVAPIAAQAGINIEEVAAAYGALTAQGTPAAAVTTQMSRAIIELMKPGTELSSLQDKLKVNFADIAKEKGLVYALQLMRVEAKKAGFPFIELFGRVEAYKFALQTTGKNQGIYNAALKDMGGAAGTAALQMSERQQGLAFEVKRLKNNLIDAGLELSAGFLPALSRSLDKLSNALNTGGTRNALKSIGEDIGKAIDGIDWNAVVGGAKTFVGLMKDALGYAKLIFDAVNLLPTEIKAAGLGLIGLNKLSGGLIGSGVGNIAGGLASVVARSVAAQLPGVGKAFVQPVFVTNMPVGGLGGAGGAAGAATKGLGMASKMFLVGEAIGLALLVNEIRNGISEGNTKFSTEIQSQTQQWLAQNPSRADLVNGLNGVQQGINDIQSNPLHTLVQGDALKNLQAMKADIAAQLGKLDAIKRNSSGSPDDRNAATVGRNKSGSPDMRDDRDRTTAREIEKTTVAVKAVREGVKTSIAAAAAKAQAEAFAVRDSLTAKLTATAQTGQAAAFQVRDRVSTTASALGGQIGLGATRQVSATANGASSIVGAISRIPAPITTVNVYVTGATVTSQQTKDTRSGGRTGSRDRQDNY